MKPTTSKKPKQKFRDGNGVAESTPLANIILELIEKVFVKQQPKIFTAKVLSNRNELGEQIFGRIVNGRVVEEFSCRPFYPRHLTNFADTLTFSGQFETTKPDRVVSTGVPAYDVNFQHTHSLPDITITWENGYPQKTEKVILCHCDRRYYILDLVP